MALSYRASLSGCVCLWALLSVVTALSGETRPRVGLSDAVAKDDARTARRLLASGSDVNRANRAGYTPLMLATLRQNTNLVAMLLAEGADPNLSRSNGWNVLFAAATNVNPTILKMLLKRGARLKTRDEDGLTVIQSAALAGRVENVEILRAAGGSLPDHIVYAAALGDARKVNELLDGCVDPNQASDCRWTPLAAAAANGHVEVVKLLLKDGANVNSLGTRQGRTKTALMWAARKGHLPCLQLLLAKKPALRLSDGSSALFEAVASGQTNIVKCLLENGADPNGADPSDEPMLFEAARSLPPAIPLLLARGADINRTNRFGATPLICAAYFGNAESVRILLAAGARISAKTAQGFTALQVVEKLQDRKAIVKLLSDSAPGVKK